MLELEQAKERIRKLLRLAENDAATDGEIENAIRFADRLMSAHHLTREDMGNVHEQAATHERIDYGMERADSNGVRLCSWESQLGAFISRLMRTVGVYCDHPKRITVNGVLKFDDDGSYIVRAGMMFYGPRDDVQAATEIYGNLARTIAAMARLKFGSALRGDGRCYGDGFVSGLVRQLEDGRQQDRVAADNASTALMVRSNVIALKLREDGKQWLKREMGITLVNRNSSSCRSFNGDAHEAGVSDGRRMNVNIRRQAKIGGSQKLIGA